MLLQMALFHHFLWLSNIPLCYIPVCMYTHTPPPHHLYPFICWWTFNASMSWLLYTALLWTLGYMYFFKLVFSRYVPRRGIARSNGNFIFSFLRNFYTVFHSCYTNLHSYQQCKKGSFFSTPSSTFVICRHFNDGHWPL